MENLAEVEERKMMEVEEGSGETWVVEEVLGESSEVEVELGETWVVEEVLGETWVVEEGLGENVGEAEVRAPFPRQAPQR